MKINLYVIHDAVAAIYNKPFYLVNDQVALRSAGALAMDENSEISKHPEDYTMWCIGEYEDTTAEIETFEPRLIARFHELKGQIAAHQQAEQKTEEPHEHKYMA